MAQNDFIIADQTASAALSDINSALQSLASCSSGSSEPSVKYANQLWYDTTTHILKVRNEANSAWISILYVHQADNAVHILDNTYISDTSGNHVGLLGDQATSEWTTGTGTTESLVSPAKIAAAVSAAVSALTSVTSAGDVGSYAFVVSSATDTTSLVPGDTVAGSGLYYGGVNRYGGWSINVNSVYVENGGETGINAYNAATLSGTWRMMGNPRAADTVRGFGTLALRIA